MRSFIRSHAVLIVLTGIYVANFMDRSAIAVVVEPMKASLGLSDAEVGIVQSILLLCLPILLIPCSLVLDLWSRRKMIFLVALVWCLGCLGTGLAIGFVTLLVARAVCSVGEATFGPGGTAWVSMSYPAERRSSMLGVYTLAAPVGMALGTLGGGLVLAWTDSWRSPFFLVVGFGLTLALCVPLLTDYKTPARHGEGLADYLAGTFRLFSNRTLMVVSFATASYGFIKFSYQAWVPAMLVRSYELSSMAAGALFTIMVLAGAVGPLIGGRLADRLQRRWPVGRAVTAGFLLCLVLASKAIFYGLMGRLPLPLMVAVGVLDAIITMAPIPVYFSMAQDVVPVRLKSMSVGLFGVIVFLAGGAWGPVVVGGLSDLFGGGAEGLRTAMLSNLLAAAISAALFFLACRHYRADREVARAADETPARQPRPSGPLPSVSPQRP